MPRNLLWQTGKPAERGHVATRAWARLAAMDGIVRYDVSFVNGEHVLRCELPDECRNGDGLLNGGSLGAYACVGDRERVEIGIAAGDE